MASVASNRIINDIYSSNLTLDDLFDISHAINYTVRQIQANKAREFMRGDKVKFTSKTGVVVNGTVVKINQKTITVKSDTTQWKVSPSLLKLA